MVLLNFKIVTVGIKMGKYLAPFGKGLGTFRNLPRDQAPINPLNRLGCANVHGQICQASGELATAPL
jgi:hypothetical protein